MSLTKFESLRVEALMELVAKAGRAVPPEKLEWKPQEGGKSAREILEHLIGANHMFAKLIQGHELPARSPQSFSFISDQLDQSYGELQRSALVLSEAIATVRDADLGQERRTPWGEISKLSKLISTPSAHIAYHWGQLCYLQTLWGDQKDYY